MKRKTPAETNIVDEDILNAAKAALNSERPKAVLTRCVICNGESAPNSVERLCWVCRRLKISAWRDADQQIGLQE